MIPLLEYREFPWKKTITYLLFGVPIAFQIFIIMRLVSGTLFSDLTYGEHLFLLGLGLGISSLTLLVVGILLGKIKNLLSIIALFSIIPPVVSILLNTTDFLSTQSRLMEYLFVFLIFSSLAFVLTSLVVQINETVVIRYRARAVGIILLVVLLTISVFNYLDTVGDSLYQINFPLLESITLVCVFASFLTKPWKWKRHPLAVSENVLNYFLPTVFTLAAYMLWYFSTKINIINIFAIVEKEFTSLGEYSGLAPFEPIFVAVGILIACLLADVRGRKFAFSTNVLLVGLLAIFGTTMYGLERVEIAPGVYEVHEVLNAVALLVSERLVEGFMLGLLLMLIWSETGTPRTRHRRIVAVWLFFTGYIALFWAVDLSAFGWTVPELVVVYGREFAILLSLISLYLNANVPEILTREVELEEISLDFDEQLVKDTVEAFVGEEEFESIRSQLEVLDVAESNGAAATDEDFNNLLPMRKVPGIGTVLEKKLRQAGYQSVAQLAGETPKRLASKIEGLSVSRADSIIKAARKLVKQTAKKMKR